MAALQERLDEAESKANCFHGVTLVDLASFLKRVGSKGFEWNEATHCLCLVP